MSAKDRQAAKERGMGVKNHPSKVEVAKSCGATKKTEGQEDQARNEKQPFWAAQQEESQGAPAVTAGAQVRRMALASITMKGDRDLGDAGPMKRCLDDHLRGELHPAASLLQPVAKLLGEPSEATINVSRRHPEHAFGQERK